ncbi:hypothetical protein IGI04_002912, partial [Brassica rapa subsp. trilocularis]
DFKGDFVRSSSSLLTKSPFNNRSERFVLSHVFLINLTFVHVFNQMVLIFYSFFLQSSTHL